MKNLLGTIVLLASFNTMAGGGLLPVATSVNCAPVKLYSKLLGNKTEVTLTKLGGMDSTSAFQTIAIGEGHTTVKIEGLQAEVLNSVHVDHYSRQGLGAPMVTHTDVYSVKVRLTADEYIGVDVSGGIPRQVKYAEEYTHCFETSRSRFF